MFRSPWGVSPPSAREPSTVAHTCTCICVRFIALLVITLRTWLGPPKSRTLCRDRLAISQHREFGHMASRVSHVADGDAWFFDGNGSYDLPSFFERQCIPGSFFCPADICLWFLFLFLFITYLRTRRDIFFARFLVQEKVCGIFGRTVCRVSRVRVWCNARHFIC